MESPAKIKIRGTAGCTLLRFVDPVDPRAAEGLNREAPGTISPLMQPLEILLEEEKRKSITDPYQILLYDVKAMNKKGNFKGAQGTVIVQRIRDISAIGTTTLDLSNFVIFDDFAELLAPYLRSKSCKLTMLVLSGTQIGIKGAIAIARGVNPMLQTLQFSTQPMPLVSIRKAASGTREVLLSKQNFNHLDAAVIGILIERERKIEHLDVSENQLTGPHANTFHGINVLFQGLKRCVQLKELNLDSINLCSEGLMGLASTIKYFSVLEKLTMSANQLAYNSVGEKNVAGIEAFCNALWEAKRLSQLNLAKNQLDYVCSIHIAQMLAVNQALTTLDVSDNPLFDAGVAQLATGLKKNSTLLTLNLAGCQLESKSLEALSETFRKANRSLQSLNISNNPDVRSQGYRILVKCVAINPSIVNIQLNPPPKYDKYVRNLRIWLDVNKLMTNLRTNAIAFNFDVLSEIQRANFVEKLQELSEQELLKFYNTHVIEDTAGIPKQSHRVPTFISSLRYYAQMEQFAPLKRLLWLFEAGCRNDTLQRRSQQMNEKKASLYLQNDQDDYDDDNDIWDYPLC